MYGKKIFGMLNFPAGSAVAFCLAGTLAFAGPAEDYTAGKKAYLTDDLPTAINLLERASASGYAPAQALLAYILDYVGEDQRALELYRKSAAQGDPDGQFGLANMYLIGEGVARDQAEAVRLMELAAAQGHGPAGLRLGEAFLEGQLGLEKEPSRGQELIEKAAAAGYVPAQGRLEALSAQQTEQGADDNQ